VWGIRMYVERFAVSVGKPKNIVRKRGF